MKIGSKLCLITSYTDSTIAKLKSCEVQPIINFKEFAFYSLPVIRAIFLLSIYFGLYNIDYCIRISCHFD